MAKDSAHAVHCEVKFFFTKLVNNGSYVNDLPIAHSLLFNIVFEIPQKLRIKESVSKSTEDHGHTIHYEILV